MVHPLGIPKISIQRHDEEMANRRFYDWALFNYYQQHALQNAQQQADAEYQKKMLNLLTRPSFGLKCTKENLKKD